MNYLYEKMYWESMTISHLRAIAFGDGHLESYKKKAKEEIKRRTSNLKICDVY
jgi:hypothetical protein